MDCHARRHAPLSSHNSGPPWSPRAAYAHTSKHTSSRRTRPSFPKSCRVAPPKLPSLSPVSTELIGSTLTLSYTPKPPRFIRSVRPFLSRRQRRRQDASRVQAIGRTERCGDFDQHRRDDETSQRVRPASSFAFLVTQLVSPDLEPRRLHSAPIVSSRHSRYLCSLSQAYTGNPLRNPVASHVAFSFSSAVRGALNRLARCLRHLYRTRQSSNSKASRSVPARQPRGRPPGQTIRRKG